MDVDLELVETQSLIDELCRRFDDLAVVGLKRRTNCNAEHLRTFYGNFYTVSGLCMEAAQRVARDAGRKDMTDE